VRPGGTGFTLLEVMVVLVLLGLLLAALTQGLRFGMSAWDLQDAQVARIEGLDATDRALRNLIEHMETGEHRSDQKGIVTTRAQMTFVGTLPEAAAVDRRAEMTLMLAKGGRLVLRWRPLRHEKLFGPPPEIQETLLLDGVETMDIAYWRAAPSGARGEWVGQWTQPGIPRLVRIRLGFPAGDRRHWPDIVIAPIIERLAG
jgi:general secretion pathway protein J